MPPSECGSRYSATYRRQGPQSLHQILVPAPPTVPAISHLPWLLAAPEQEVAVAGLAPYVGPAGPSPNEEEVVWLDSTLPSPLASSWPAGSPVVPRPEVLEAQMPGAYLRAPCPRHLLPTVSHLAIVNRYL